MSIFKKVTAAFSAVLITLLLLVFCLLFTAPGNQFIAYSANKMVEGLNIELKNGRFIYNDAFNVSFKSNGLVFNAEQMKLNLFWWQCDGLCIDNLSAKKIKLVLPSNQTDEETAPSEPLNKIELPFNIAIKHIAINTFSFENDNADVIINGFTLSAKAQNSIVNIKSINIPSIEVALKAQTQSASQTTSSTAPPLRELPALPNIEFVSPIDLIVEQFDIDKITINQDEQQQIVNNFHVELQIKDSDVHLISLAAKYQQWQLNTQLNSKLAGNNPINGSIDISSPEHQANLSLAGDLANLILELNTSGLFPARLDINANLKQKNYPFTLTGTINQWLLNNQSQQLNVSDVALNANGNASDYTLTLSGKSQLGAYPAINVKTRLKGGLTQANLNELSIKANESVVNLMAKVDWQQGIEAQFTGSIEQFKAQYVTDQLSSDISGGFDGDFFAKNDTWQLKVNNTKLQGILNNIPIDLAADFDLDNELKGNIKQLNLSSGLNNLTLSGKVDQQWRLNGDVLLKSDEQANLPFIADGSATIAVRGERLTPAVDLAMLVDKLIFNDINLNQLSVKAQLDTAADWQTNLAVKVGSADIADQHIRRIILDATGDKTDHQLTANVDAEQGSLALELSGKVTNTQWNGVLSHVQLSDNTLSFNNSEKIAIEFDTQTSNFNVSKHCWHSANSELCVNALSQQNDRGELTAQLSNLALSELKHFLPDNMRTQGDLKGDLAVVWQASALKTLTAHIQAEQLNAVLINEDDRYDIPFETVNLNAVADAQNAQFDLNLNSSVLGAITTHATIEDIQNSQKLTGKVDVNKILLTDLQPFLDTLEKLKGQVSAHLVLGGTLTDPQVDGELNIDDITLEGEQLPVALQKSTVNVVFNKTAATVKGTLNDTQGGNVQLTGDIDWQGEQPDIDLAILGDKFFVRAQQGVTFKVSPDLNIALANNALKLVGEVTVPYGRIEIEELPEGAVQVSDDEIIIDQQTEANQKVPFDYDIDLKVIVKNDVKIESFGLESKVAGDIAIKMSQGTPIIASGELNLIDGTYLAFGQDLVISTGQVGFSGSIEKPYLNIKAIRNPETTENSVIAGVKLTGNVDQPKLSVFSEPAMDQAQALAYLLNGQPLGDGESSSTDAMLTQLLLSQGVSRSEGVVSKVGEKFGLSDVSLSSSGSGDSTKVEISGYIAPSLQVKYSVGIFDSLSEVAIRYKLLSQLFIEITSGLNQNVDVLYKFDWE
jgi:translocation and assembly module TamB